MAIGDLLEKPGQRPSGEVAGVPVTVLTTDAQLCEAIRTAAHGLHPVFVTSREEEAKQLAAAGRCAILITDEALTLPELARITKPLRAHEPALVTIAVGSRSDDNALIGLLSTGVADRFMLKPVMPALAKLAIRSAAREHQSLKARARGEIPPKSDAPRPSIELTTAPLRVTPTTQQVEPPVAPEGMRAPTHDAPTAHVHTTVGQTAQPQATQADAAQAQTSHAQPLAEPAVILSEPRQVQVKRAAPPRPTWIAMIAAVAAVAGLVWWVMLQRLPDIDPRQVIATNLANAQEAFADGRYLDPPERSAFHYFNAVLSLDPANAQARQGVERIAQHFVDSFGNQLDQGRLAQAVTALEGLRRVRPDHEQLPALEKRLHQQLQEQLAAQVRDSAAAAELALARSQAEAAKLAADKKARAEVDNAVQQGIRARVLADASQAIDRGQLDIARMLIDEAQSLGASDAEIAALNQSLATAEAARSKSALLQLVLLRTQQNQLLEPAQDSARYYLQKLEQTDKTYPGLAQGVAILGAGLVANAEAAIGARNFDLATQLLAQAHEIGFKGASVETAEASLRGARAAPVQPAFPEPKLVRLVRPEYPKEALMRGIEGWADVSLLVTASGDVSDPRVEASSRAQLFERPALAAVRQWKYEPRSADDPNLGRRVRARVQFRLKDDSKN